MFQSENNARQDGQQWDTQCVFVHGPYYDMAHWPCCCLEEKNLLEALPSVYFCWLLRVDIHVFSRVHTQTQTQTPTQRSSWWNFNWTAFYLFIFYLSLSFSLGKLVTSRCVRVCWRYVRWGLLTESQHHLWPVWIADALTQTSCAPSPWIMNLEHKGNGW